MSVELLGATEDDDDGVQFELRQTVELELAKDARDALLKCCSFSAQEIYFLWDEFGKLTDHSYQLSEQAFVSRVLIRLGYDPQCAWVLNIFKKQGHEKTIGFQTWVLCADRATRGTTRDLIELCLKALDLQLGHEALIDVGHSEKDVVQKLRDVLRHLRVDDTELEDEAREVIHDAALLVRSDLFRFTVEFVIGLFLPITRDMESKLKRPALLTLPVVCMTANSLVPPAIEKICSRVLEMAAVDPTCGNFVPESMHVHKTMIEALANAFLHGWTPVEGVSVPVLLMVLRTYLRHFSEGFFPLNVSDVLMKSWVPSTSARLDVTRAAVDMLPVVNKATLTRVVEMAGEICCDRRSLEAVSRVLAWTLLRTESSGGSTTPVAVEITSFIISNWNQIKLPM